MPLYSGSSWHYSTEECQINLEFGVRNLVNLFALATNLELTKGVDWYPSARRQAEHIDHIYQIGDLDKTIKVAAAISPKCPWETNMDSAEWVIRQSLSGCFVPDYGDYAEGRVYLARVANLDPSKAVLAEDPRISAPPMGGLKANVIKALWVMQGIDCLSGPKVTDFFWCIKAWETYLGACIDSHAIQGWFGKFDGGTYGIPPAFYTLIRADYIKAAEMVGLSPLQFQAVLWLVKKRISKEMGLVRR